MKVKWTEYASLSSIPEQYWGEDLSKLDHDYEGDNDNYTKQSNKMKTLLIKKRIERCPIFCNGDCDNCDIRKKRQK
jgi:hypothetical protein